MAIWTRTTLGAFEGSFVAIFGQSGSQIHCFLGQSVGLFNLRGRTGCNLPNLVSGHKSGTFSGWISGVFFVEHYIHIILNIMLLEENCWYSIQKLRDCSEIHIPWTSILHLKWRPTILSCYIFSRFQFPFLNLVFIVLGKSNVHANHLISVLMDSDH